MLDQGRLAPTERGCPQGGVLTPPTQWAIFGIVTLRVAAVGAVGVVAVAVDAFSDSLRLLVVYAANATGKQPVDLDVTDLDAALIVAFLTHLETARNNSVTTRNTRLAAIRSLFRHAALQAPEDAAVIADFNAAVAAIQADQALGLDANFSATVTGAGELLESSSASGRSAAVRFPVVIYTTL